jgi:hypothetical protein
MATLIVDFDKALNESVGQIRYALTFLSEDVVSYDIDEVERKIRIDFRHGADVDEMRARIDQLLRRYSKPEFGMKSVVSLDQRRELPIIDAWGGLLERRWATPVGEGHVVLRGPAAQLLALVDHKVQTLFVKEFRAELEIFPSTIKSDTLHRCNHFTSFPEHMDFVAHLKRDLDILSGFANACREDGWSARLHEGRMSAHDFAVSPSCCYHAYEGMEGWNLKKPGRCITAILNCHRYEGANHAYMSRLRAFTMREVIWVGQPAYVIASRARADEVIQQWAKDWELSCTYETANDMFFTDDFAVKASFQRQQEAKRELRMEIPSERQAISVFSSNFHSTTFGKAFDIRVDGRTAASACAGWGAERWVYSLISQFGFDVEKWPPGLKRDYEQFTAGSPAFDGY